MYRQLIDPAEGNKELYIRIPSDCLTDSELVVSLKGAAGQTLRISVIKNSDAPFPHNAISAEDDTSQLTFFGPAELWDPTKEVKNTFVDGHPECSPDDCRTCHNVSCGIYQGYDECVPREETYIYSGQL